MYSGPKKGTSGGIARILLFLDDGAKMRYGAKRLTRTGRSRREDSGTESDSSQVTISESPAGYVEEEVRHSQGRHDRIGRRVKRSLANG
jgi:hypothetical protein